MLPRPLDTLLAYKAISLTAGLSGTEKRVAAAVVDSFNRKTGQCDPSFDRIAHLLGISRRSVIRAVGRVEQERLFSKVRHGGKFYRNSYQPNWVRFREIDAQWGARIKTQHWKTDVPNLSPSGCQSRHHAGDEVGTQTNTNNHSKETTSSSTPSEPSPVDRKLTAEEGYSSRRADQGNIQQVSTRQSSMGGVQSRDAALGAAERRWNSELSQQFASKPTLYAELIDLIDLDLQSAATEHEMKRRGGGLAHILQQLELKNIRALRSDIHAGTAPDNDDPALAASTPAPAGAPAAAASAEPAMADEGSSSR
jgi:Helix-turn-helix domain